MSLPNTYLLTCPDKDVNQLGTAMSSHDMVKGLRRLNPTIVVPEPNAYGWYPGKAAGMTCLWYGKPSCPGSKKVCAFHLGTIPEFTQIAPGGDIIVKGWREIFKRVIDRTPITATRLEREFRVSLSTTNDLTLCVQCMKEGIREVHNGGARGLCDMHDSVKDTVETMTDEVFDNRYTLKQGARKPPKTTVIATA